MAFGSIIYHSSAMEDCNKAQALASWLYWTQTNLRASRAAQKFVQFTSPRRGDNGRLTIISLTNTGKAFWSHRKLILRSGATCSTRSRPSHAAAFR